MEPGMGEPGRGAKPAGTGPDHDSIRTNDRHFTSQKRAARLIRAVLDLDHSIIIRLAVQTIFCNKGRTDGFGGSPGWNHRATEGQISEKRLLNQLSSSWENKPKLDRSGQYSMARTRSENYDGIHLGILTNAARLFSAQG